MASKTTAQCVRWVSVDAVHFPAVPIQQNTKKQIDKAARFLAAFHQVPLIYRGLDGKIVCGEEIWLALKASGASAVDVIDLNDRSPDILKAVRLALHRIPPDAQWFVDPPDIDTYLSLDLPTSNMEETGSDFPPVEAIAVSALGSVWALEKHRIGCADATDLQFMRWTLKGQTAALCFTDPPYNLSFEGFISGRGRHHHRGKPFNSVRQCLLVTPTGSGHDK